jgi:hypothetical protein
LFSHHLRAAGAMTVGWVPVAEQQLPRRKRIVVATTTKPSYLNSGGSVGLQTEVQKTPSAWPWKGRKAPGTQLFTHIPLLPPPAPLLFLHQECVLINSDKSLPS